MLIYTEDFFVVGNNILELTKILYDSNCYKIVIHPMAFDDINNIKNKEKKKIIYNKLQIYNIIDKPPQATKDFNLLVGYSKISNDLIYNNLLYAVYKDCVSYLITNDKKIKNKAQKIGIADRILGIEEAISKFKSLEEKEIKTSAFILHEYLYNIELNDNFFDSLKKDYNGFEIWYKKKSRDGAKAYITRDNFGNLGSFLMLKIEDETEDYSRFEIPFKKGKRLKVSTFKVTNTRNKIGESYIKIIISEAIKKKVDEIYLTIFEKQEALINLFLEYGFFKFTTKETQKADLSIEKELVLVKNMNDNTYPNFSLENKNVFIVPIQQQYHEMLFPESENYYSTFFCDIYVINTYLNTIKKAYIYNSSTNQINHGDILLFYESENKKSIITIGIVDNVFGDFSSPEELYAMATKRTMYSLEQIKSNFSSNSKLLLFKYYKTLDIPISYEVLKQKGILKMPPVSIIQVSLQKLHEEKLI